MKLIVSIHENGLLNVEQMHSYDILGAGMLWKPKEARILTNFIDQLVNIGKHLRTKNVLTRCFTKNFQEF
jgi:hypothetical protein